MANGEANVCERRTSPAPRKHACLGSATVSYTPFDLPSTITQSTGTVTLSYGANIITGGTEGDFLNFLQHLQ